MKASWIGWVVGLLLLFFVIPTLLVKWITPTESQGNRLVQAQNERRVKVYLEDEKRILNLPLEEYVEGVVAAEMPVRFAQEALKAQALTARTYIIRRIDEGDYTDMLQWGATARGAVVSNTVKHQAFLTAKQLQAKWGTAYAVNRAKIQQAVTATTGQVITYHGKPIYAAFFSTSNGNTENAEDYFTTAYPYLRSVRSPWDRHSPKFHHLKKMSIYRLIQQLEAKTGRKVAISTMNQMNITQIQSRTKGKRVGQIRVGDQLFSGREVREALQLSSSDFTCWHRGRQIWFFSRGYGHGVGMSQWGAHYLAGQGRSAAEIVRHYYTGVTVERID